MKISQLLISFFLIFLFSAGLKAQRRNDFISSRNENTGTIIFSIGPQYCFGDTKQSPFAQSLAKNWDVSLGFREMFPGNFGFKALINCGNVSGSDGNLINRSYSFSSKTWQMSVQGIYSYNFGSHSGHSAPSNSLYSFLGVGLISSSADLNFIPRSNYLYKTNLNNQLVSAPFIPYGFGYEYRFRNNISIGIEYNIKYTFSDYIDGFKPPFPDSRYTDILESVSITLGYKIF